MSLSSAFFFLHPTSTLLLIIYSFFILLVAFKRNLRCSQRFLAIFKVIMVFNKEMNDIGSVGTFFIYIGFLWYTIYLLANTFIILLRHVYGHTLHVTNIGPAGL